MTPDHSSLLAATCVRPPKLYRYSQRAWLERSLQHGEFTLQPGARAAQPLYGARPALPFAAPPPSQNILTLSLSTSADESLYDRFDGADCCLVIDDPEQFGERLHRAVQRMLPNWAGIDAAISYGMPSGLGAIFSKARAEAAEQEWLFAWRPAQSGLRAQAIVVRIGSIEGIAGLRSRSS